MITYLKVTTVFLTDEVSREVSQCISRIHGARHSLRDRHRGAQLQEVGDGELPDILIYEMSGGDVDELEEVVAFVEQHRGELSVVVLRESLDADSTRRLMRAGVRDVLPLPLNEQELVALLTDCVSEKRRRVVTERGNLAGTTCFLNAKGGSGATTLAVNTACELVKNHDAKVALLDFDIQFGDVCLYLDLKPRSTISDALRQSDRLDPIFLETLMTTHKSGLHVLASPSSLDTWSDISVADVNRLLETVVESYDFVLIDVPPVMTPWVLDVLKFSEHIMMVVQNSLSTIKNAKQFLHAFPAMGVSTEKIEFINNRAMTKTHSVDIDKLKSALGRDRIHRVWNDFQTALSAQDHGVSLDDTSHRSKMTRDVMHLADYIWHRQMGEDTHSPGFFARWFGRSNNGQSVHSQG